MVKVVSTEPHPSVVKQVVCRNCGATLEYVPADVQKKMDYDYSGSSGYYHYVQCPPCGNEITVNGF